MGLFFVNMCNGVCREKEIINLHLANFFDCWSRRSKSRRLHVPQQKLLCWEKRNKFPMLQMESVFFLLEQTVLGFFLHFYIFFMCSNCCLPCLNFKSSDPSLRESPLSCVIFNMSRLLHIGFLREFQPCCMLPLPYPSGPLEIDILQVCSLLYGLPSLSDYISMSSIW